MDKGGGGGGRESPGGRGRPGHLRGEVQSHGRGNGPLDGPQEGAAGRGGHPDLVPPTPPALTGARQAQVYLQFWLTAWTGGLRDAVVPLEEGGRVTAVLVATDHHQLRGTWDVIRGRNLIGRKAFR